MSRMAHPAMPYDVDVLIAGGGPSGLVAALALAHHDVRVLVAERRRGLSQLPKARALDTRAMEVLRRLGVAGAIAERALDSRQVGVPFTFADTLATAGPVRNVARARGDRPQHSPVSSILCPQNVVEDVLRAHLVPGVLRTGVRVCGFVDTGDGVRVDLLDAQGRRHSVRARYLIGADGANSLVRQCLGIPMRELHRSAPNLLVLFEADLSSWVGSPVSNLYFLDNGGVRATLQPSADPKRWTFNRIYDADAGLPSTAVPDDECIAMIHTVIGGAPVDMRIVERRQWVLRCGVAERFTAGRIALAGDAAHVVSPFSGSGMNLGVQDADNLAWKLAALVHGFGGDRLLDTYDHERRPIATWTSREDRVNLAEAVESATGWRRWSEVVGTRLVKDGLVLGARYDSTAVFPDPAPVLGPRDPYADYLPTANHGHRAPHIALERCNTESILDYFGPQAVLLTADPSWTDAVAWANSVTAVPVRPVVLPASAAGSAATTWCELYGVSEGGAVLVRPDGYVAWRCADPGPELGDQGRRAALTDVLTNCWSLSGAVSGRDRSGSEHPDR